MSKQRTYVRCRVCGVEHQNPRSSSLCPSCGEALQKQREAEEENQTEFTFNDFMQLDEDERWQLLWEAAGSPSPT